MSGVASAGREPRLEDFEPEGGSRCGCPRAMYEQAHAQWEATAAAAAVASPAPYGAETAPEPPPAGRPRRWGRGRLSGMLRGSAGVG